MKVLIAGGSGFIGRHLIESLTADSHQVWVLSRNPNKVIKGVTVVGWDGKTTHPYKVMMHYYRLWEKPRTASLTKESYWKHVLRKPIIPSDYFELKELWESATEVERSGIFALMMHYGVVKDKGRKSQADKNALCQFRKRHGIGISRNSVSVSTRQKRRKRLKEAS